jgi:ABC-type amino acid transport substrate-binding protein
MVKFYVLFGCITALVIVAAVYVFRAPLSGKPTQSDSSLSNIKKRGKLIVAADIEYEPMEFFDKQGKPAGLDIDIVREIAKELGVTIEIANVTWDDFFTVVEEGKADIGISSVTILPERAKDMLFTNPYLNSGQVIVVKKGTSGIMVPGDLKGKKVGVQIETTGRTQALLYADPKMVIDYTLLDGTKENPKSGLIYDLKSSKVDAGIFDYVGAASMVKNNPDLVIVGEPFTQEYFGIITKLGNTSLVEEMNLILNRMKRDGRLQQIKDLWLK